MMISQTMPALPMVDAEAPVFDHGETEDKPIPVPKASRMSDNAAATNAPAIPAAQETPDAWASFLAKLSANPGGLLSMAESPERSIKIYLLRDLRWSSRFPGL